VKPINWNGVSIGMSTDIIRLLRGTLKTVSFFFCPSPITLLADQLDAGGYARAMGDRPVSRWEGRMQSLHFALCKSPRPLGYIFRLPTRKRGRQFPGTSARESISAGGRPPAMFSRLSAVVTYASPSACLV
jgi:hypothetical protein